MGIGLCPQGRRVFPTLSVRENLLVAQQEHDVGYRWDFKEVYELFPRLGERAGQRAGRSRAASSRCWPWAAP